MKVIIVGGVAGGASCAARLRRLDEGTDILMVERGPYVSYANCGLPYYVGRVIEDKADLLVADTQTFRETFAIDARTNCEVVGIDAANKTVDLRDNLTGAVTTEAYDSLVVAPGAAPIHPHLPGIDLPGIFSVRTVPDAGEIRAWIDRGRGHLRGLQAYTGMQTVKPRQRAVIVGGGFIGLEMAENLVSRDLDVTLINDEQQVLPPLDPDMSRFVERHLESHGVHLVLGHAVTRFQPATDGSIEVQTVKLSG